MTDQLPSTDIGDPPGPPRWVKVFGIIALVILLLLVILMVVGGGNHGPSRHRPSADAGRYTPAPIITEGHPW